MIFKKSLFKAYEKGWLWVASVCSGEAHLCLVVEEANIGHHLLEKDGCSQWVKVFLPQYCLFDLVSYLTVLHGKIKGLTYIVSKVPSGSILYKLWFS